MREKKGGDDADEVREFAVCRPALERPKILHCVQNDRGSEGLQFAGAGTDQVGALTLTQPWATLVALGHKRVETRSWTTYRHRDEDVAIHAAVGGFARDVAERERELLKREPEQIPLGAIVAIARGGNICRTQDIVQQLSGLEIRLGDYRGGRWAWKLDDIRALAEPIPCRGALGLWALPREIEIALERFVWEERKATEGTRATKGTGAGAAA